MAHRVIFLLSRLLRGRILLAFATSLVLTTATANG